MILEIYKQVITEPTFYLSGQGNCGSTKWNYSREHQLKAFVTLSGFWPLSEWSRLSESVKQRKACDKNLFSDNLKLSSKKLKIISVDEKTNIKQ